MDMTHFVVSKCHYSQQKCGTSCCGFYRRLSGNKTQTIQLAVTLMGTTDTNCLSFMYVSWIC